MSVRAIVFNGDGTWEQREFAMPVLRPGGAVLRVEATGLFDEGSGLFGGYAEYMELVPGSAVHRLREDVPAAQLTVFESLCNAVTWVHPVNPGDVLVVEGPGHMGLAASSRRRREARGRSS